MSRHSHAYLVAGVRLTDIYQDEMIEEEAIRYDDKTGIPRQVKVQTRKRTLFGKPLEHPEEYAECFIEDITKKRLTTISASQYSGNQNTIVGLTVVDSDDYDSRTKAVTDSAISDRLKQVESALRDFGCEIRPQLFLVLSVS